MAYLNITLNLTNMSVADMNARLTLAQNGGETINNLIDIISGTSARIYPATVVVTSRNTDPAVATDGGSSEQKTISKT